MRSSQTRYKALEMSNHSALRNACHGRVRRAQQRAAPRVMEVPQHTEVG